MHRTAHEFEDCTRYKGDPLSVVYNSVSLEHPFIMKFVTLLSLAAAFVQALIMSLSVQALIDSNWHASRRHPDLRMH